MQAAFPASSGLSLEHLIDYAPVSVASETTIWDTIALMNQCQPSAKYVLAIKNGKAVGFFSSEDILRLIGSKINLRITKIAEVMTTSITKLQYSQLQDIKLILAHFSRSKELPLLIEDEKEQLVGCIAPENITNFLLENYQLKIAETEHLRKRNQEIVSEILSSKQSSKIKSLETLLYFRQAIASSSEAIIFTDLKGNAIYINSSFFQLFNRTCQQLNALGGLSFFCQDTVEYHQLLTTIKQGKTWRNELKMKSDNDEILYIKVRTDAVKDSTGKIIGTIGIHTNVTEEVQAQENLHLKNKAITASSNGIAIFDVRLASKPIVYANSEFERVSGDSISGGWKQQSFFIEDINFHINKLLKLNNDTGLENLTPIIRNYCKDGNEYWYQVNISPIRNNRNKTTHYLCVQSDITKHKLTEMSLLLTQEKLKHLLFSSTGVIYSSDICEDYGVNFISDNIVDMVGYQADEILCDSRFWLSHIHPEDSPLFLAELMKLSTQNKVSIEYRFLHNNGDYIWIYEQSKLVKDYTGNPLEIIGYRIDITERKALEENLKEALEKEKEVNELKSRFIAMTSHEFRTPLSTILSSSELLENYRNKWNEEKQQKHFNRIKKAVQHMTNLLTNVLFFGKVEAEKIEFNPINIDLVKFSRQLIEDLQINQEINSNSEININIDFISNKESIVGYLDEKILEHIFNNLLSNAIKYSNPGTTVKFAIYAQEEQVLFEIEDKGIGIPSEDLPSLFDSFHRCNNVGNIPGTGLGLSIVKKCVDMHHGKIDVTSKVGVGTKFSITFPLLNS